MRLTLDHDNEKIHDLHYPGVKDRVVGEQATLSTFLSGSSLEFQGRYERWRSSGREGFHYIEPGLPPNLTDNQELRQDFGDDQLRISLDQARAQLGSPFYQVLYHLKELRPHESRPYRTGKRATLLERQGFGPAHDFDAEDSVVIWTGEGDYRIDYQAVARELIEHPDFGSGAALWRAIEDRSSVVVATEPRKRAFDVLHGRRPPQPAERKALRDYAMSRDVGHYRDGEATDPASPPDAPDGLPRRTTFHEYFSVPDLTGDDGTPFGADPGESKWLPANLRVGTYNREIDEDELKAVLDALAPAVVDMLAPGTLDLSRLHDGISLERARWLDRDEVARYRQVFWQNQPPQDADPDGPAPVPTDELKERGLDPFKNVLWELIIYGEGYGPEWYVARGVLPTGEDWSTPLTSSYVIADTKGWITAGWGATPG